MLLFFFFADFADPQTDVRHTFSNSLLPSYATIFALCFGRLEFHSDYAILYLEINKGHKIIIILKCNTVSNTDSI